MNTHSLSFLQWTVKVRRILLLNYKWLWSQLVETLILSVQYLRSWAHALQGSWLHGCNTALRPLSPSLVLFNSRIHAFVSLQGRQNHHAETHILLDGQTLQECGLNLKPRNLSVHSSLAYPWSSLCNWAWLGVGRWEAVWTLLWQRHRYHKSTLTAVVSTFLWINYSIFS